MSNIITEGVLLVHGQTKCNLFCSVALGYDEGTALIKIGREEPVASMDSSGKIIWAHHNEIQTVNVKSLGADTEDVSASLLHCCSRHHQQHHCLCQATTSRTVACVPAHQHFFLLMSAIQQADKIVACNRFSEILGAISFHTTSGVHSNVALL